jgi:hypothetical protein
MQTDRKAKQEQNVYSVIRDNLEPNSNVTTERASHSEKTWAPMNSTDAGIEIDCSSTQDVNAALLIRFS